MAITLVGMTPFKFSASAANPTISRTVTAGNTLILVLEASGDILPTAVTQGATNFTKDYAPPITGAAEGICVWSLFNAAGGASTITITMAAGNYGDAILYEVSGLGTSSTYDAGFSNYKAITTATPTGTSVVSSAPTNYNQSFCIGVFGDASGTPVVSGTNSGWTNDTGTIPSPTNDTSLFAHQITNSSTSLTFTVNFSSGSTSTAAEQVIVSYGSGAPIVNPLILYLTSTTDTLLATSKQLSVTAPTAETSFAGAKLAKNVGWTFVDPITQAALFVTTEPSPNGHGWIYDSTALENQQIVAGTWTPVIKMSNSSTWVGTIHVRAYKYNAGAYTLIGDFATTSRTMATAATVYTLTAQSLSAVTLGTGDKIYIDVLLNITTATSSATATSTIFFNGGANESLATPGYISTAVSLLIRTLLGVGT